MVNMDIDNVLNDFINMINNSWTYNKMTESEQERCINSLTHSITKTSLRSVSNYKNFRNISWSILQAVYSSYLLGIGCTTPNWREDDDVPKF